LKLNLTDVFRPVDLLLKYYLTKYVKEKRTNKRKFASSSTVCVYITIFSYSK